MKKSRTMFAIVCMATMMAVSASFAGMAETAVETVSEERYDTSEDNSSDASETYSVQSKASHDSSGNGSFETTDKTVDENDSVEFDEEETPEVEKEHAEEIVTTGSSDTAVEVTGKDDVSVSVDEIVIEKNNNDFIVSSDSEIIAKTPEDHSSLITENESDLESDVQFETTSKVVGDVDVIEFDQDPVKNEVIVTPEVPEEDLPTDLPPEVVEPKVPESEVPIIPELEKPRVDHNDYDDNNEVAIYSNQIPVTPVFLDEPSPRLAEIPVFVDEPTSSTLPKTGDSAPLSGYIFASCLVVLVVACLLWTDTGKEDVQVSGTNHSGNGIVSGSQIQKAGKEEPGFRMYLYSFSKLCSVLGKQRHPLLI